MSIGPSLSDKFRQMKTASKEQLQIISNILKRREYDRMSPQRLCLEYPIVECIRCIPTSVDILLVFIFCVVVHPSLKHFLMISLHQGNVTVKCCHLNSLNSHEGTVTVIHLCQATSIPAPANKDSPNHLLLLGLHKRVAMVGYVHLGFGSAVLRGVSIRTEQLNLGLLKT